MTPTNSDREKARTARDIAKIITDKAFYDAFIVEDDYIKDKLCDDLEKALESYAAERVREAMDNASEWLPSKTYTEAYKAGQEDMRERAAKAVEFNIGTSLETSFDRALVDGAVTVVRSLSIEEKS